MACCQEVRDFTSYLASADSCGGLDNEVAVHFLLYLPYLWEEVVDGDKNYRSRAEFTWGRAEIERSGDCVLQVLG